MGKEWDKFTDSEKLQAFAKQWATEALRVAKPGAIMLCFGGTRTVHRIACGIEDAGWEIRDRIFWIHGQGFPKSRNISKAIDEHFGAKREVIGKSNINIYKENKNYKFFDEGEGNPEYEKGDITAPATDQAKLWDGWGTSLKPAHEPIIVAMKPRDGTFVENALKWGVAGLNIDGGRVGTEENLNGGAYSPDVNKHRRRTWEGGEFRRQPGQYKQPKGRWPANIILGYPEDEYELKNNISKEQKKMLYEWMNENT